MGYSDGWYDARQRLRVGVRQKSKVKKPLRDALCCRNWPSPIRSAWSIHSVLTHVREVEIQDQSGEVEEKGNNENAVSPEGKNRTKPGIRSVLLVYSRDWSDRESSHRDCGRIVCHQSLCRPFQATQQPILGISPQTHFQTWSGTSGIFPASRFVGIYHGIDV